MPYDVYVVDYLVENKSHQVTGAVFKIACFRVMQIGARGVNIFKQKMHPIAAAKIYDARAATDSNFAFYIHITNILYFNIFQAICWQLIFFLEFNGVS